MWPFPKPEPKPKRPPIRIVIRRSGDIRLDEWRKSPALVTAAMKVMAMPEMRAMLDVVRTEAPANYESTEPEQAHDKIEQLGVIKGYQRVLNVLEAMAILDEAVEPIEATFAPEEVPEDIRIVKSTPEE